MASDDLSSVICLFCKGLMRLQHHHVFNPYKPDHGPFDIHLCSDCGSCQTDPMPSSESLGKLYGSYRDGLPDLHRTITADDPQNALYEKCISRIHDFSHRKATDAFTWIDVGSGGGEFAQLMAARFPASQGSAIDLHSQPKLLNNVVNVAWHQVDINEDQFSENLPQFDVVASIAVLEHVLRPDKFIRNLFRLLKPGGMVYLVCPDNGSLAGRLLGRKWPYFNPGEHLAIPTPSGVMNCLQREWRAFQSDNEHVMIAARPMMLPYTIRYIFRRLGLDKIGKCFPAGWSLAVPSGALEATVIWNIT